MVVNLAQRYSGLIFESLVLHSPQSTMIRISILLLTALVFAMCSGIAPKPSSGIPTEVPRPAAYQTEMYLPLLQGKRVAVVANQTTLIGNVHLVDSLVRSGIAVRCVFAPEHGFRGDHADGQTIADGRDKATGLPVYSLYGKTKKPSAAQLADVDVIVFDIQDVGARFYTFISTMHYAMEAAAELGKEFMVLDRPNPHGFYIDGPVLKSGFESFVGMHRIPIVHGCTVGELALMINGERWLSEKKRCALRVIPCVNYVHTDRYKLPVAPSPNLPNMNAIYLYPSLCLFEGTVVSVGRGTDSPFQIIGYPDYPGKEFLFTPTDRLGFAMDPPHEGKVCRGKDLRSAGETLLDSEPRLHLSWLIEMYRSSPSREAFFNRPGFFDKLAGGDHLRKQIEQGLSEDEIRLSWQYDLASFRETRSRYLLYPESR